MGNNYSATTVIGGTFDKEYESVKNMFRKNFECGKERDAQLCVYVDGKKVVDLWGSAEGDESYNGDSLQCVFSSSKAITAIAIASLADKGLINYSTPVARYFPEFAAESKGSLLVEDLMRHEAGLANLHSSLDLKDLYPENLGNGNVAQILAKNRQVFPENTPREYHNFTAGLVINEIVRRVTPDNTTLGIFMRREFFEKLGLDIHLGLKKEELSRTRPLIGLSTTRAVLHSLIPNAFGSQVEHNIFVFHRMYQSFKKKFVEAEKRGYAPAYKGFDSDGEVGDVINIFLNSDEWRKGESPHANVHASARALAKLAAAMAHGGSLHGDEVLTPNAWSLLHANPVCRPDAYMGMCRTEFTQGGVNMYKDYEDDKIGERVMKSGRDGYIGWKGFGGSVIQWHPHLKIGFGYACTFVTWWDLANIKARKLQKEVVVCTKRINESKVDENNNTETA